MRLILTLLLATSTPAFAADPLAGLWRTPPGADGKAGLVRIAPCGPAFCGTVVDGKGDYQGLAVLRDVPRTANGYRGGEVLNPETGNRYTARLILRGDVLEVGGCILGICRTGSVWQRAD